MKTVIDLVTALKTYFTGKDTAAKQAVEANIAPVETDASSSAAPYSVGDQLILNDILYDVTASISISDALVVGTNIAAASDLSTQIGGKQDQIEVTSMPTASASNVGQVLIYIGATTSTYTSGQSYQSTYEGGAYIWKPVPTAEAVSYDGTQSGSSETDVQGAIDDLYSQKQTLTNQVKDMNNVYGSKNLLIVRQYTRTYNGVSITVNDDGSISFKGTPSAAFNLSANTRQIAEDQLKNDWVKPFLGKECIFSSNIDYDVTTANITIAYKMTASDTIHYINSGSRFTFNEIPYLINVSWYLPTTLSFDTTWKPMIRLASIEDDTHEPYAKTNQQLTQDTTALLDNTEVNGAVNMLPNTATTQTINGVTFTVNSDGTIIANGANTSTSAFGYEIDAVGDNFVLPAGSYKLTGCPSNGGDKTWRLEAYKTDGTTVVAIDNGNGAMFTLTEPTQLVVKIRIGGSAGSGTLTNLVFKPMITVSSYNGDYVPYAKSNKELTDDVAELLNDGKPYSFGIMGSNTKPSFLNGDTLANKTILEIFSALPINFVGENYGTFAIGSEISVVTYSGTNTLFSDIMSLTGLTSMPAGLLTIKKTEAQRGLVTYNTGNKIFNCRIINNALETCYLMELTPIT